MEFEDLSPERQHRLKECKTPEELMDLADELDTDLSSEQLEAIAGGLNPDYCKKLPYRMFLWGGPDRCGGALRSRCRRIPSRAEIGALWTRA